MIRRPWHIAPSFDPFTPGAVFPDKTFHAWKNRGMKISCMWIFHALKWYSLARKWKFCTPYFYEWWLSAWNSAKHNCWGEKIITGDFWDKLFHALNYHFRAWKLNFHAWKLNFHATICSCMILFVRVSVCLILILTLANCLAWLLWGYI